MSNVEEKQPEMQIKRENRRFSRRNLLKFGASLAAIATVGGTAYYATRRVVNIAILGAGVRGLHHARLLRRLSYFMRPYANVVAICDAQLSKAQAACRMHWPDASSYQDYREILERTDVEAVIVCPCDHWHAQMAIDAMHCGKAVYCEKPLSVTIAEGRKIVEAVDSTKCVFQVGTQQRSQSTFRTAVDLLINGRLGELKRIVVTLGENVYQPGKCTNGGDICPDDLDWELWLGPTPLVNYCKLRHHSWGAWYEYSGGQITGWGSHHLDIGIWAMGSNVQGPTYVEGIAEMPKVAEGFDVPQSFRACLKYPNDVEVEIKSIEKGSGSAGILLEGTRGRVFANRGKVTGRPVEELSNEPLPRSSVKISDRPASRYGELSLMYHYLDFFRCIDTHETPVSDIWSSQRTNTALHLCNISMRLGRPLNFDPATGIIIGDDEANAMISRRRRAPFEI